MGPKQAAGPMSEAGAGVDGFVNELTTMLVSVECHVCTPIL